MIINEDRINNNFLDIYSVATQVIKRFGHTLSQVVGALSLFTLLPESTDTQFKTKSYF